jgi:hypothetical protein
MQGYQRHNGLQGSHCLSALYPCPIEGLEYVGMELAPFLRQPIVPVSPGHVRSPYPYPPSRRRRR